ncbi:hypothetical protein BSP14_055 [Bacillus phage BSP14]|nr:hypothetical protein BSP14_055 [Bacillus phage BSP14]AYJ76246.1 hypothetical protein BSP12_060 [Bacillus phage BSP12]
MASFSQDTKWIEAKKVVGHVNWIEVVSYYRSIGGTNVFVYSVVNGDKRLIVDVIDDDEVLLIGKADELLTDSYTNVLNSRKVFKYSEELDFRNYYLRGQKFRIPTESQK